jgi:hypothetical protein
VYLEEVIIKPAWRGKGIATLLLPKLFELDELKGTKFMFTWPTVLNHLEPPSVNGMFGTLTPDEQAARLKRIDCVVRFFQKVITALIFIS